MADYKLYCFGESGNAYKVALMLELCRLGWEPVKVEFFAGETRGEAYRKDINEMGEAPVLVHGAKRLAQSGVILDYLAEQTRKFGAKSDDERREMWRWILFDNHKFTSYFASYRFMKAFGATAPDAAVMAWLRGRLDNAFGIVEKHLTATPFMVGKAPTIADFSLSGYLFYPTEESGYEFVGRFPHIGAWLDRLRTLPGWASPYDVLPGERVPPKW